MLKTTNPSSIKIKLIVVNTDVKSYPPYKYTLPHPIRLTRIIPTNRIVPNAAETKPPRNNLSDILLYNSSRRLADEGLVVSLSAST